MRAEGPHPTPQDTGVHVVSVCPAGVTELGMYSERRKHVPGERSSVTWLYEVPLAGVVRSVLAQIRLGAPAALVPVTLLPLRLAGCLQHLAPDWATAAFAGAPLPGNPFAASWQATRRARDARKEE